MMEHDTGDIIQMQFVDKREAGLKSTNMEKIGFQRALESLIKKFPVKAVVTDAHVQIGKLMSKYSLLKNIFNFAYACL